MLKGVAGVAPRTQADQLFLTQAVLLGAEVGSIRGGDASFFCSLCNSDGPLRPKLRTSKPYTPFSFFVVERHP